MEEVTINITLTLNDRIKNALVDARENAQELLSIHDSALGRATKKNQFIAEMYEHQIKECDEIIRSMIDL